MLNVGFDNYINKSKVLAITVADIAPLKRLKQSAQDKGIAIDCTFGRMTRSLVHMTGGVVILSYAKPETLIKRMEATEDVSCGGDKRL